jgi:hypothetical protein
MTKTPHPSQEAYEKEKRDANTQFMKIFSEPL